MQADLPSHTPPTQASGRCSQTAQALDPGASAESAVFNYQEALQAADPEVVEIIAELFVEQWSVDVLALTDSIASADLGALRNTAHSLKGTLGHFGAEPAVRLAFELEQLAANATAAEPATYLGQLNEKLAALSTQVNLLLIALANRPH